MELLEVRVNSTGVSLRKREVIEVIEIVCHETKNAFCVVVRAVREHQLQTPLKMILYFGMTKLLSGRLYLERNMLYVDCLEVAAFFWILFKFVE